MGGRRVIDGEGSLGFHGDSPEGPWREGQRHRFSHLVGLVWVVRPTSLGEMRLTRHLHHDTLTPLPYTSIDNKNNRNFI